MTSGKLICFLKNFLFTSETWKMITVAEKGIRQPGKSNRPPFHVQAKHPLVNSKLYVKEIGKPSLAHSTNAVLAVFPPPLDPYAIFLQLFPRPVVSIATVLSLSLDHPE